jgi:hypothetical protein
MINPKKIPLNDDERQAFIDNLPLDEVNADVKEIFEDAIERASQPQRSKRDTLGT